MTSFLFVIKNSSVWGQVSDQGTRDLRHPCPINKVFPQQQGGLLCTDPVMVSVGTLSLTFRIFLKFPDPTRSMLLPADCCDPDSEDTQ